MSVDASGTGVWPALRVAEWTATRDTVHMWTQIVGKVRMVCAPMLNHWWHVTLYVTPRGLSTGRVPYRNGSFDVEFDFCDHALHIRASDGSARSVALRPRSVADFYAEFTEALAELGITVPIHATPNEVDPAIPFAADTAHASYDPDAAHRFWRQLVQADRVLERFRAQFTGKSSPVHYFWGSMDLAVTRFSGRTAPRHPGGAPNCPDWVMTEGYSHELSSAGFWPGGGEEGAFYSYAYPEPAGFADYPVLPEAASYNAEYQQFLLPYEAVRTSEDPDKAVAAFLHSTHRAAAELAHWKQAGTGQRELAGPA